MRIVPPSWIERQSETVELDSTICTASPDAWNGPAEAKMSELH